MGTEYLVDTHPQRWYNHQMGDVRPELTETKMYPLITRVDQKDQYHLEDQVFCVRQGEYQVVWQNRVQLPIFNSRGAALAYLAGLERGRKRS
jgi:hypothetical protein